MGPIIAFFICIIVFVVFIIIISRKVVPQNHIFIIERLGSFYAEWETGQHFLLPFIDKIVSKVSLDENVIEFKPQPYVTKDNVTIQIDTVVSYQVTNAKDYTYGIEQPLAALEKLTAITLRNIIGDMELNAVHRSQAEINKKLTSVLDQATDRWGISVKRAELKKILRC